MRVLFVSHSSRLLGAETSLLTILDYLDHGSFQPIVLIPSPGPLLDALAARGIETRILAMPWWLGRRNSWPIFAARIAQGCVTYVRLSMLLRHLNVDIVYTNSLVIPMAAIAAKSQGLPHVWHVRELPDSNETLQGPLSLQLLYRLVRALSTRVVCNSSAVERHLKGYGLECTVVNNPVELRTAGLPGIDPFRGADRTRLLVVGSLSEAKGQRVAIEALAYLPGDMTLHIVGSGPTDVEVRLRALARRRGVDERVFYYGHSEEVGAFYRHADLVVVPSVNEAFGRTAVEALMAGCRVVGSDSGGLSELLPPDRRFPAGDAHALAAAARQALAEPFDELWGQRIAETFEPNRAAAAVMEVLRSASA